MSHSHNDYDHMDPFWEAYSQRCLSIEASHEALYRLGVDFVNTDRPAKCRVFFSR